jgi:O-Antigen ligase
MNKFTQNLFLVVYPFYPLWAAVTVSVLHYPADKILIFLVLPILLYIIWNKRIKIPVYLFFFISFTVYHLCSVFYNDTIPDNTTPLFFFFSDPNVLACILLLVVENTHFNENFIIKMNRHILWIVVLSLVVSLIQIKSPTFFYNPYADEELIYVGEGRAAAIYSWLDLNSIGITFPILISILLNVYDTNSKPFSLTAVCGIIVAFLTKARYIMISTLIAFLQLLLIKTVSLKKKLYVLIFFIIGIFVMILVSEIAGYDIAATIDERILEKGGDMESAKARVHSYDVFMLKFPENPYFGVGPKTRDDVIELMDGQAVLIHVGYLAYLYYYGFFGAMLLFLALLFLLWDAWVVGRRYEFWGSFYGLIGFALANATFIYFIFSEMGIVLAVLYIRYYKSNFSVK